MPKSPKSVPKWRAKGFPKSSRIDDKYGLEITSDLETPNVLKPRPSDPHKLSYRVRKVVTIIKK